MKLESWPAISVLSFMALVGCAQAPLRLADDRVRAWDSELQRKADEEWSETMGAILARWSEMAKLAQPAPTTPPPVEIAPPEAPADPAETPDTALTPVQHPAPQQRRRF